MADFQEYWGQLSKSEKFQDLEDDKKEKVRQHLFDSYIQRSPSYQGLPQSQRIQVKKHFDDVTKIQPEGLGDHIVKVGKKAIAAVQPAIDQTKNVAGKAMDFGRGVVDETKQNLTLAEPVSDAIMPAPVTAFYKEARREVGGMKSALDKVGEAIEPSQEQIAQHVEQGGEMTNFDVARMIASGSVRTVGELLIGGVPTNYPQTSIMGLFDSVAATSGLTFLGKERHLPGWKPKTGLAANATGIGDDLEKIITKRRIENNSRNMSAGPAKPLEVLAREEEKVKTQGELDSYEEWLKQADALSDRGGQPAGDIHPDAKVNVSQLRDAAKERLQKLQTEPVRIESLGRAEDEVKGFFRRQIDQQKVYMMPPTSDPLPETPLLPGRPEPAGLLPGGPEPKGGPSEVPKSRPAAARPAPTVPNMGEGGVKAYKDYLTKAFAKRLPEETQQTVDHLSGTLLSALKDSQYLHPTKPSPLDERMMGFLDQVVDQAAKSREALAPKATSQLSEVARLREKGIDHSEVMAEAKRLHAEHQQTQGISEYERAIKDKGGLGMSPADPASGKIPEREEYLRNVPAHLRGKTMPDQMAQHLHELGLQEDASSSTMYRKLSERKPAGEKRSIKSFMDEAERNVEQRLMGDAGFVNDAPAFGKTPAKPQQQDLLGGAPEDLALRGEQAPEQPPLAGAGGDQNRIPGTAPEFPDKPLRDVTKMSAFDLMTDTSKRLGEKGQIGGGEVDPVRQAAIEANIKELVDRAMSLGYETTQDIMLYAAKNAPAEFRDAIRKNLAPTLSPFDTHAYKEIEAAKAGNPIAKKSLMDSAMRDYLKEKYEWAKGIRQRRSVSKIIGQFHDGDEAKMKLVNELFIHDHLRKLDGNEAAALRWYIEKKAPSLEALKRFKPEDEAKAMLEKFEHPTDQMKKAAEAIRPKEDEWHALMSEFYDSLGYAENYVTRRWKQSREYLNWEGRVLGDRVPFVKERKLVTHADGINAGYEPKSFDVRDDIRAANDVRTRLLTRLHDLRKIASTVDHEGHPSILLEEPGGQSTKANITAAQGKAPDNWLRYRDIPMLRGLAINPDYKPALDYIFGARYKGLPIEMYEHLGSLSKASILGYSLFHPASLTEMLLGGISYRDVFTFNMQKNVVAKLGRNFAKAATADLEDPLNWKDPIKSINALYKSFMSGHAALANRPLALDMAEHGFKLGSVDDVNYNILSKTMLKYEGWLKAREATMPKGKAAFKEALETVSAIRTAGDVLQKAMWDYQRPLFSMHLYETHLADNIKKFNLEAPEGKKIPIDQIKFQTNNFISKMVGGISMGTLLATPRAQQFLQWAMMAPDWTIGRALMPAAAFTKGPEGRQARKLMLRMGISYFVFGNLLNYHNSQTHFGKGRFMWENDPGHEMEIMFRKDKTGRSTYIQVSKAFTEIYDDLMHPAKTAAYKANPNIHAAVKMMNWATSGSFKSTLKTEGPMETVAGMFQPRTFSGLNAYGTFPIHKGISRAQVMDMFGEYYKTGNPKLMDQAMRYGMESGFDVNALARAAKARGTGQIRRKEREDLLR